MHCLMPFAPVHISWYQTLHFWHHTQSPLFKIWPCKFKEENDTRHLFGRFFVTMNRSAAVVRVRLLWLIVVSLAVVGIRHSLFRLSSRFWSQASWQTKIFCLLKTFLLKIRMYDWRSIIRRIHAHLYMSIVNYSQLRNNNKILQML